MKAKRFILKDRGIRDNCHKYIDELPSDTVWEVHIRKYVKPRSESAHGYYRALRDILSDETGYEKDEMHDMLRLRAGLVETICGVEVPLSTNKMSSVQMSELIEFTIRMAAQELEISLPAPSQVWAA
jgi:hypothetical protein